MYRYFYIGQLQDGGDLEQLTGVVATQLKGSNISVIQAKKDAPPGEFLQKQIVFWAFIGALEPGSSESAIKCISESGKLPTATLCFDSPLSPADLLVPSPYGIERNKMLSFFAEEADPIGFIQLEHKPRLGF